MRKRWPQKSNPHCIWPSEELTPEGSRPVVSVAWPARRFHADDRGTVVKGDFAVAAWEFSVAESVMDCPRSDALPELDSVMLLGVVPEASAWN